MYRYEYQATPPFPPQQQYDLPPQNERKGPNFMLIFLLILIVLFGGAGILLLSKAVNQLLADNTSEAAFIPTATPNLVSPREVTPEESPLPQVTIKPSPSTIPAATPTPAATATPTPLPVTNPAQVNGAVAYMRNGEIWKKDIFSGIEQKISVTQNLGYPVLSSDARRAYYYDYPTQSQSYGMYITDIQGHTQNKFTLPGNKEMSRPKWSADGEYLGVMLFAKGAPGNVSALVPFIFRASTNQGTQVGEVKVTNASTGQYQVTGMCNVSGNAYNGFCEEYIAYLNQGSNTLSQQLYKKEIMEKPEFRDNGYTLTRSELLQSGDILAEYSSGNGTYVLLVDDQNGQVHIKIDNASQAFVLMK